MSVSSFPGYLDLILVKRLVTQAGHIHPLASRHYTQVEVCFICYEFEELLS